MGALRDARIRVPDDVAVVGFTDIALAAELPIPLSRVASTMVKMGRCAVTQLLATLDGAPGTTKLLTPELHVRASSDPTRRPVSSNSHWRATSAEGPLDVT